MAPRRPPPTHKDTPSAVQTHQKTKKVVSTSALFAQVPKLKAAPALRPQPCTKKPRSRRMVAVVMPKKHPLMDEFDDATTAYASSLLSEASTKLLSAHETLVKRLVDALSATLTSPSEKNLRAQLAKSFPPTPAIANLQAVIDRETPILASLQKDYTALTSELQTVTAEIFYVDHPNKRGNKKAGTGGARGQLDQTLIAAIQDMRKEIDVLGDEEIEELDKERRVEAKKRKRIADFFQGLDEEEE